MKIIPKFFTTTFALMLLCAAPSALAQGRIATVNLSKLFDDYWKTKQAKAAFEDQKADLEKEGKGMLAEFKALVQKNPIVFDEASWQKDLDFIKAMLRLEIDMDLFGVSLAYQNLAKRDPQLQYAVSLFPEAQQLLESGRQAQSRRAAK